MSVRREMIKALRLSPRQLGDSSALVCEFLRSQLSAEGGFCDRSGRPDLYYTVFGLDSLVALGNPVPSEVASYLRGFGRGEKLDLVHLCCLIRCRAIAGVISSSEDSEAMVERLERYRSTDGGYNPELKATTGSAYGCFLVAMTYEDLARRLPSKDATVLCLKRLKAVDGGYGNQPDQAFGLTPSTSAVATLLHSLGGEFPPGLDSWLFSRCHPEGGFFAIPAAPIPDLLSTATALHALSSMGASLVSIREPCLDFVQSLWTGGGAFAGSWADSTPDCEYTYYGLLALGTLSA